MIIEFNTGIHHSGWGDVQLVRQGVTQIFGVHPQTHGEISKELYAYVTYHSGAHMLWLRHPSTPR